MDLQQDNKNIYTIDRESYSQYMQDNGKEPKDILSRLIKILLVILFILMGYFLYKIVKADLSFFKVFNKKELLSTYDFFTRNDKPTYIKEDCIEVVTVPTDLEQVKKIVVLKEKKYDEELFPTEYLNRVSEGMNSYKESR